MIGKNSLTLGAIALALLPNLGCGQNTTNVKAEATPPQEIIPKYETRSINGKIEGIDEDSFAVTGMYSRYVGADFQYEVLRIKDAATGATLKLITTGPSSYAVGDTFSGQYAALPGKSLPLSDLIEMNLGQSPIPPREKPTVYTLQLGSVQADGVILQ